MDIESDLVENCEDVKQPKKKRVKREVDEEINSEEDQKILESLKARGSTIRVSFKEQVK